VTEATPLHHKHAPGLPASSPLFGNLFKIPIARVTIQLTADHCLTNEETVKIGFDFWPISQP
jgi:hypothetical protein